MKINVTSALLEVYPEVNFFGISVKNIKNIKSNNKLEKEKRKIESSLRKKNKDPKKILLIKNYNEFFNMFNKTVPLEYQISSVLKGKEIPQENVLKDVLFLEELNDAVLISGHDLDKASSFTFDVSSGKETYKKISGKSQKLKPKDIILKDGKIIITSLLYGPGFEDRITKDTKDVMFLFWFFKKISNNQKKDIVKNFKKYLDIISNNETKVTEVKSEIKKTKKAEYIVTPWEVTGNIDYNKLITEFGVKPLDKKILKRVEKVTGESHYMIRRNIFFSHMYLDKIMDEFEKGNPFYLYTGRAPSGPVHLGHLVPWIFTKWLQDKFKVTLLFQIPDEEKFLFKQKLSLDETKDWAYDNILDIIALGFDPKLTKIFLDTEYAGHMYKYACMAAKKMTFSTIKSTFGFDDSKNIGIIFYTAMQSVPAFLPTVMENKKTRVLIPCAIDQDVHFRLTRDVAESLGFPKPATILCRFLPGLGGISEDGKMSSSAAHTTIWTTDSAKQVKKKIMKYAFSGGRDTLEEHRKLGGNPDIDVSFQWLTFFEEDDKKIEKIYKDYKSGKLLSGELKQILVDKINNFLAKHQKRREQAKDRIEEFMLRD